MLGGKRFYKSKERRRAFWVCFYITVNFKVQNILFKQGWQHRWKITNHINNYREKFLKLAKKPNIKLVFSLAPFKDWLDSSIIFLWCQKRINLKCTDHMYICFVFKITPNCYRNHHETKHLKTIERFKHIQIYIVRTCFSRPMITL